MTVTDEMRKAGCRAHIASSDDGTGTLYTQIYLAMRALDPEIVALRNDELNGRTYRAAVDYYDPLLYDCETELAEEAAGYEEMLSAKNEWADRALKAETELATLRPVVEAADEHEKASSDDGVMLSRVYE